MGNQRELGFEHRMSDAEALMWNVEKDPWLNPSGAAVTILDRVPDREHFRRVMRAAVAAIPRLHERVVPGIGRLSTPVWVPDPEFDLDFHIRWTRLPEPGTERQLFDLATHLYLEPFDRTRPLWRFVVIEGLEDGRAALWSLFHHAVADGIGQMRISESYQQGRRETPPPDEIDLEAVIAERVETAMPAGLGGDLGASLLDATVGSFAHLARRQLGRVARLSREVASWPGDPARAQKALTGVATAVQATVGGFTGLSDEVPGGSPLWTARSRHRHLDGILVPLDDLVVAARRAEVTVNDVFHTAMAEAAARYHTDRGVEVEAFNTTFVLSTRTDSTVGGNSFTPVPVQVPGAPMPVAERLADIHERLLAARQRAAHGGGMSALSSVANLLPTSVVTRIARARAAHIDFATSNLRGAPFPLYMSGARVQWVFPMGPVAGTACNATAISHDGTFGLGVFVDPAAIEEPDAFADHVAGAFADLL